MCKISCSSTSSQKLITFDQYKCSLQKFLNALKILHHNLQCAGGSHPLLIYLWIWIRDKVLIIYLLHDFSITKISYNFKSFCAFSKNYLRHILLWLLLGFSRRSVKVSDKIVCYFLQNLQISPLMQKTFLWSYLF